MTEPEWLSCTDSGPMLEFLKGKASDRKLRLFAVACVKRAKRLLREKEGRHALELAERLIERPVPKTRIRRADYRAPDAYWELIDRPGWGMGCRHTAALAAALYTLAHPCLRLSPPPVGFVSHFDQAAFEASVALANAKESPSPTEGSQWLLEVHAERKLQTALLQDISGNPFRPGTLEPSFRMPHVTALTATIYDKRAFDRMPVLADALEVAGCTDADLLTHCRGPGLHVRGCWVVDAVLAKA
jgi:hypothetical protein